MKAAEIEVEVTDTEEDILTIETINVTSFHTNKHSLLMRNAQIIVVQEHAVDEKHASAAKAAIAEAGWNGELGPVDPEHSRPSGGVGVLAKMPRRCVPIKAKTEHLWMALELVDWQSTRWI